MGLRSRTWQSWNCLRGVQTTRWQSCAQLSPPFRIAWWGERIGWKGMYNWRTKKRLLSSAIFRKKNQECPSREREKKVKLTSASCTAPCMLDAWSTSFPFPRFRQTILSFGEFLLFLGARREKSRIPLSERDSAKALNAKFLTRDFLLHGDPYIATDHNQRRFPSPVIDRHLLML